MATKTTCDRCGQEVTMPVFGAEAMYYKVSMSVVSISYEYTNTYKKDLCYDCQQDIGGFALARETDDGT